MRLALSGLGSGMQTGLGDKPPDAAQGQELKRLQQLRAPIAQLLLVARLRASNRRGFARDLLERAVHVLLVTCKSWFSMGHAVVAKAPAFTKAAENPEQKNAANADPATATTIKESSHAHRHD